MELFVIRRRNVSRTPQEMEAVAAKSRRIGDDEMSHKVRWIRSYVVKEADGTLGTVCIYQAVSPQAIREHAQRVGMPADEIVPVAATVIVREDPRELEQAA
jgi:thiamine biosynthesis protein ThiC